MAIGLSKKGCHEKCILCPLLGRCTSKTLSKKVWHYEGVCALIFEVHCEARGANFFNFSKNARNILRKNKTFFKRSSRNGLRVPNREWEICENVARNGFRVLLSSARSTIMVANCGPVRGLVAKALRMCTQLRLVFGGFLFEFSFIWGGVGL